MMSLPALSWINTVKRYWLVALTFVALAGFAALQIPYVSQKAQLYAIKSTEELLGAQLLSSAQEQKIKDIAQKMGISRIIAIRKMNTWALGQFGYHNAFAYFPRVFNIFPLGNHAFIYISEGFFEDLSPEEQDFLIGHELMHIKLQHTKYASSIYLALVILSTLGIWWLRKRFNFLGYWVVTIALWITVMWAFNFGNLAYRRHIERVADIGSLEYLGTCDGLLKLSERWLREYKMQLHHDYYGIFADHPSVAERKAYCLESQQKHKGS